jgi:integrase
MPKKLQPLDVEREKKPGKYADGDGLYLIVVSEVSKNWSYRYWFKGKERWHGLGSFKDVSLKQARLLRDAARLRVRAGVDLVEEKRTARQEAKAIETAETAKTFKECAQTYIDEHWDGWSKKHRAQWPSSLKRFAYPTIGHLTIVEIKPSHIYDLLKPIWIEKRETANRVRGRIETIIAKNVDVDDKDFRNPAEITKQLREKLPRRPKRVVRHHPALPYTDASQFMADLSGAAGAAAAMLRFLIFTACRTNEVVEARWSEIDLSSSAWRIPGERMKMNQDHVVPLSDPALAILDEMRDGSQGELIFQNPEGGSFSENAMLAVLDRLGYGHATVHGFRSTFATWGGDCTDHPDGVREAALAHKYKSETTAAYQRGQKLEKRRARWTRPYGKSWRACMLNWQAAAGANWNRDRCGRCRRARRGRRALDGGSSFAEHRSTKYNPSRAKHA